jgi:uncharacterized protein YegJ (DUF2314 family)
MIQVKCQECGYIQTLSEERFLSISESYLTCPHCSATVPKQWSPASEDNIPEEARHKMLAFSRRILNGRNVGIELSYALESLVRHYGVIEDADKALGIGYAAAGETSKALEFLCLARDRDPGDVDVLRNLLEVLLAEERYEDAAEAGIALMDATVGLEEDNTVAGLALALIGAGRPEDARALLEANPNLDPRNSLVKKARKQLNRAGKGGLRDLFRGEGRISRFLGEASRKGLHVLTGKGSPRDVSPPEDPEVSTPAAHTEMTADPSEEPAVPSVRLEELQVLVDYWIYTSGTEIPSWDAIRRALALDCPDPADQEATLDFLAAMTEKDHLAIEYIRRDDAPGLFEYPDDIIEHNSRHIHESDRRALAEARTIVRLRLSLPEFPGLDYLVHMMRFADAVRSLAGGVVQDAVSHTLWGADAWSQATRDFAEAFVDHQIQFELLDEGGTVWLHTHGMQKFGLPELEMEQVPEALAASARRLMTLVVEAILETMSRGVDVRYPLTLGDSAVCVDLEERPRDDEGHFPAGSLMLLPFCGDLDRRDPETWNAVLAQLPAGTVHQTNEVMPEALPEAAPEQVADPGEPVDSPPPARPTHEELRDRLVNAHRRARRDLGAFRKSFEENRETLVHAVKVGFPTQGGKYEWMWVSLDAWRSGSIEGHLENTPILRTDLLRGTRVQVTERDIFDWAIAQGGSVVSGAYTEGILS